MNPNEPPGRLGRIASIFSRGWPGLLVLIWTMLSHASTAQFAARVFGDATAYLDKHSWVGVLVGSTFIAIAVSWPDLKKHLPKMPKTQQEKLDALSERIDAEVVTQNKAHELLIEANRMLNGNISLLHDSQMNALEKLSKLSERLYAVESQANGLKVRLDEQKPWIFELEGRIKEERSRILELEEGMAALKKFFGLTKHPSL